MTDLGPAERFEDWRDLVDHGLATCTCRVVSLDLFRDDTGRITHATYSHTDIDCRAVAATITADVKRIVDPPDHQP